MKKISLVLMIMMLSATAMAKSLVVTLSDGSLVYYLLGGDTNPMMKFADGKMVINTDVYEISGIKNFYISDTDDPNGIEQTFADKNISFDGNMFIAKAEAKSVKIYGMSGMPAKAEVNGADGVVSINLSKLPQGAYIIKIGDASFKVMKK